MKEWDEMSIEEKVEWAKELLKGMTHPTKRYVIFGDEKDDLLKLITELHKKVKELEDDRAMGLRIHKRLGYVIEKLQAENGRLKGEYDALFVKWVNTGNE